MTHLKFYIKSVLCSLVFFILLILFIKNIYYPALKITIEVILTFSIGSLCYAIFCKTNRAAFLPISVVLFLMTLYLLGVQCFSRNFVSLYFYLGEIITIEILVALSGVNLLSRFFKKKRSQQICQWIIKTTGKIGIFKMKHFFAGFGEINFINYLLYVCVGLAPLFHIYVIGSEMSFVKIVLSILGIIFVCILTIARIYRNFFYKEQFGLELYLKPEVGRLTVSFLSSISKHVYQSNYWTSDWTY